MSRAADAIAVKRCDGQGHVAAVASTGNTDAASVQLWLRADPVEQSVDVFVRVFAQKSVIEHRECLAEAGRSAHVRKNQGDSQLVQKVILPSQK